ncbi:hypothetical protein GOV05_05245, partial [Candidatus Woesearchaeota archaeon]|nr:hypothetical protein [Candidatus Woesearchaeota archaeon]
DFELVHGSRDYFQIKNKVVYELVPVLDITDYKQAVNVTDMSPLHVDYLRRHADSVMRDEIRLTKQFCKSIGVYGAESFIAGFSGHIIDLLIIRYKSFINLLEACTKWSEQIVIDLENHLDDPFNDLNASKIKSALVIVDPVDPNRNASAALSKEKLLLFKKKASMFLDEPSKDYFVVRPFDIENVKKKKKKDEQLIILELTPLLGKVDVVGAKLKKGYEHIKKQLNHYDFKLINDGWNWDKKNACFAYYFLEDKNLSAYFEKRGPPIDNREDVFKFKDKHKEIYTKNSYTYAKVKRKYVNPNTLIIDLLKGEYLKAKFKRAKKEVIKK